MFTHYCLGDIGKDIRFVIMTPWIRTLLEIALYFEC